MAFRIRWLCFICNQPFRPALLVRIDGDENIAKSEIAIRRREEFELPPLHIDDSTRLCINCNRSVTDEIFLIENNPDAIRLNVLTQTASRSCVICNAVNNVYTVSTQCRVNVFVSLNIFVPAGVKTCQHHLDDRGFFLRPLMLGFRYINRPYVLGGRQLEMFLQELRQVSENTIKYDHEENFTDADFEVMFPLTKVQFRDIFNHCDPVPCLNI